MGTVRKAKDSSLDKKPRKKLKKALPHKKKAKDAKSAKDDTGASQATSEKWSKSKKKRMRKLLGKLKKEKASSNANETGTTSAAETTPTLESTTESKSTNNKKTNSIQAAFKARLAGSRFRILNEELYTTTSQSSYDKFKANPELFEQYHEGFRHQVESWPENPVDIIVRSLSTTYNNKKSAVSPCVVADFGCGDAQLAKDLLAVKGKKRKGTETNHNVFKVHSFDLVSPNELVTACDMANVPLKDKSVDVCVFCLSLMGTNLADFIREAHRVLKDDGRVKIAEVRSRIEYSHSRKGKTSNNKKDSIPGNDKEETKTEGTLEEFTGVLAKLGFVCVRTDRTNTMFLLLELKKNGKKPDKKLEFSAKPCIYKRR